MSHVKDIFWFKMVWIRSKIQYVFGKYVQKSNVILTWLYEGPAMVFFWDIHVVLTVVIFFLKSAKSFTQVESIEICTKRKYLFDTNKTVSFYTSMDNTENVEVLWINFSLKSFILYCETRHHNRKKSPRLHLSVVIFLRDQWLQYI